MTINEADIRKIADEYVGREKENKGSIKKKIKRTLGKY